MTKQALAMSRRSLADSFVWMQYAATCDWNWPAFLIFICNQLRIQADKQRQRMPKKPVSSFIFLSLFLYQFLAFAQAHIVCSCGNTKMESVSCIQSVPFIDRGISFQLKMASNFIRWKNNAMLILTLRKGKHFYRCRWFACRWHAMQFNSLARCMRFFFPLFNLFCVQTSWFVMAIVANDFSFSVDTKSGPRCTILHTRAFQEQHSFLYFVANALARCAVISVINLCSSHRVTLPKTN